MELVKGEWHGDVDLNDGQLHELYKCYKERQHMCSELGLKDPRSIHTVKVQIECIRNDIMKPDMAFVSQGK